MNTVDVPQEFTPPRKRLAGEPIRLVYVGGLHLGRWRSLSDIAKALSFLQNAPSAELIVYAPAADLERYGRTLCASATMKVGGTLRADQVFPALAGADVLIHVESFEPDARRYTRLSLSTKVPQYMSAARPVFAYGPAEVASCRYIMDSGCGRVVGEQSSQALAAAIRELLLNEGLRHSLGRRAWHVAKERHEARVVRERFREALTRASSISMPRIRKPLAQYIGG